MRVFVYGTLKRGFGNYRLLKDAKLVGRAETVRPYVLLDSGFPVMTPVGTGASRVAGEVYEFEDESILKNLDRLEGEGRMYDRVEIDVETYRGQKMTVWTYLGRDKAFAGSSLGVHWLDGDVFNYREDEDVA